MWQTTEYWRQWITLGDFPDHPWRAYLQRSALTLKGLTYAPTGALLAASTTSLPETPGGERNWDYRYAWVRDSTFALWGLYTLGLDREANDFFYFIADVSGANDGERHPLQVMYGVGGERSCRGGAAPPVRLRRRPPGPDRQRRVRPAAARRLGRRARLGVPARASRASSCPRSLWPVLKTPGRGGHRALARARPRHLGGPRRAAALHVEQDDVLGRARPRREARRPARRARVRRAVADHRRRDQGRHLANGVDDRGVFTQRYGDDALDASLLLALLMRFLPPDDPRVRATVLAIADELTVDGLVLRYRVEETDDGLTGEEGTFTICSFWLVSALVEIGELEPGQAAVRAAAVVRQPARAVRRGDRPAHRPSPRQLPAGVHPPGADQRGRARDPGRGGGRQHRGVSAGQRPDVAGTAP